MLASCPRVRQGSNVVFISGIKGDIAGGHITVIEIDIHAVGSRRHLLSFSKPDRSATAAGSSQEPRVEIKLRLRRKSL
jgi:hypothetical protein